MPYVHEDAEFDDLLRIVAERRGLSIGLIEKDYWVTHTLWALRRQGFELWFKGGTSLSKAFGLSERFSEDLDLKIGPGAVTALPRVSSWTSEGTAATAARRSYFERLAALLDVPGTRVSLDRDAVDRSWRSAGLRVTYPGHHLAALGALRPFVLLEVGSARVTPFVERDMTSFVHEFLEAAGQLEGFEDNRPRAVRCVHPLVTLIEKLDALHRRVANEAVEPPVFVRHFEDAARIAAAASELPALESNVGTQDLAREMLEARQIRQLPESRDMAFTPVDNPRWAAIRTAYAAITPMFWGERTALDDACAAIREWIERTFEQ